MAIFSYVYYWTYISKSEPGVGEVLDAALRLDDSAQLALFGKLANLLVAEGLLPGAWWLWYRVIGQVQVQMWEVNGFHWVAWFMLVLKQLCLYHSPALFVVCCMDIVTLHG